MLIGGVYAAFAPLAFLSGLQAGLHVMGGAILMGVLGSATVLLAFARFTRLMKCVTFFWGATLGAFFVYLAISTYDPSDIGGTAFFAFASVVTIPIALVVVVQSEPAENDAVDRSGSSEFSDD